MSKKVKFSNQALKAKGKDEKESARFNLVTKVNSFNSMFDVQKLDAQEEDRLESMLESNWIPDKINQKTFVENLDTLKSITAEIKAIARQGAILIGERVFQARALLKNYKDGVFTLWLESTFGARKTGYNMLAYYEFFTSLPNDNLRSKYKIMPQRAAYSLANRKGDSERKLQIVDLYYNRKSSDIIDIIQKEFAIRDARRKKSAIGLVNRLLDTVDQLVKERSHLTKEDLEDIKYAKEQLTLVLKK